MFRTRITEMLHIEHPVIQGAMLWMSKAELVAAVSNAGGLGILSSATFFTADAFREEVRKTRGLTDKPFAVNLVYLPLNRERPNEEFVEVMLREGVEVVETVGQIQPGLTDRLHAAGVTCMHKVTSVRHALSAERSGIDAVTVEGLECAGHPGMDNVTSLIVMQRAVQQVKIPVIAAGGFGDGAGLVAALAMGAEAVQMGTRFFLTKECPAHPNIKERYLEADETDTVLALATLRDPVRYMRTELTERVLAMEARGAGLEELVAVVDGLKSRQALETGDLSAGVCVCGQSVGLIHDVPAVSDLMASIMDQARAALRRVKGLAPGAV